MARLAAADEIASQVADEGVNAGEKQRSKRKLINQTCMSGDKFFPQTLSELPFHRRPKSISGDGFFSDSDRMHVAGSCCLKLRLLVLTSSVDFRSVAYETSFKGMKVSDMSFGFGCFLCRAVGVLGSRGDSDDQFTFDSSYMPPNTLDFETQQVMARLGAADEIASQVADEGVNAGEKQRSK
ncbi:hypothetical protein DY000_02020740 [Brassica cretica]|uniref:Uncharacterized protein n=1 Tax=Brassica cretica TaxID=69181 RepID=A0ABQ7EA28_BRACR|nr:hypothetical protein DY000_02020740 [Brassica cretica]